MTVDSLLDEIRRLSVEERKQLISLIVDTLAEPTAEKRSILEFEGIAADLADDEDPQEYLKRLRSEWDNRP